MKRLLILFFGILLCFPLSINAQELINPEQPQPKPDKHSKQHHELGLDIGPGSVVGGLCFGVLGITDAIISSINNEAMGTQYYGHYGFRYYSHVAWWCQVGGKLVFEGVKNTHFTDKSKKVIKGTDYHVMASLMPSVRFTYLNRKWVRLYSGIDLGVSYFFTHQRDAKDNEKHTGGQFMFAFDITPLGISVGHNFYLMAETNIGTDSFVKFGLGARF